MLRGMKWMACVKWVELLKQLGITCGIALRCIILIAINALDIQMAQEYTQIILRLRPCLWLRQRGRHRCLNVRSRCHSQRCNRHKYEMGYVNCLFDKCVCLDDAYASQVKGLYNIHIHIHTYMFYMYARVCVYFLELCFLIKLSVRFSS